MSIHNLGMSGAERELVELADMLEAHNYDPRHAMQLQREGIGTEELAGRLRVPPYERGGLLYTHGFKPMAARQKSARLRRIAKFERSKRPRR